MTDRQRRNLEVLADPVNRDGRITRADRETIDEALREIDRLTAERDGHRRGLALVHGEADPDWDVRFAGLQIENLTLAREVERLRGILGYE